jgi:UDP-N-acetylglucosamine:LPS N-acetylglucosamine transferase
VPYVVDNGFGVYTYNKPRVIADTVAKLFQDEDQLLRMSKAAKSLSRPGATKLIAKDIADIALRTSEELPVLERIKSEKLLKAKR